MIIWDIYLCNMYLYLLNILGASEVSAKLYCNSRTSVLGRLLDYLRLLMGRTLYGYLTELPGMVSVLLQHMRDTIQQKTSRYINK